MVVLASALTPPRATISDLRAASIALRDKIKTLNREVVIHAIGFSDDHNFRLLNDLRYDADRMWTTLAQKESQIFICDRFRKLGTKEGVFQYAEAADGEEALLEKIHQLFNLVNSSIGDVRSPALNNHQPPPTLAYTYTEWLGVTGDDHVRVCGPALLVCRRLLGAGHPAPKVHVGGAHPARGQG